MKSLKFSEPLPEMILRGKKTVTWRLFDEKNIQSGDTLLFCRKDGTAFAKAVATSVREKAFSDLTQEDYQGHEMFPSFEKTLQHYSECYRIPVTEKTNVKIIRFKLA